MINTIRLWIEEDGDHTLNEGDKKFYVSGIQTVTDCKNKNHIDKAYIIP